MVGCSTNNDSEAQVQSQIKISCDAYDSAIKGQVSPSGRNAIKQASKLAKLDSGYLPFASAVVWDVAFGGNRKFYTPDESLEGQRALSIIAGLCEE